MMINTDDRTLADDDIPVITELPAVPPTTMPAARVQSRYHALLREVDRDGGAGHAGVSGSGLLRRRSLRWKLAASGTVLGAMAVALALGYGTSGSGQGAGGDALTASWTPTPRAATPAETKAAERTCLPGAGRILLAEQRGTITAILADVDGNRWACIDGQGHTVDAEGWNVAAQAPDFPNFGTAVIQLSRMADFQVGQVGPDVASATVTLSSGTVVSATVAHGWAFVWWPGNASGKTVTEYAANGTIVETFGAK
jgi:hypothetical protein